MMQVIPPPPPPKKGQMTMTNDNDKIRDAWHPYRNANIENITRTVYPAWSKEIEKRYLRKSNFDLHQKSQKKIHHYDIERIKIRN